MKFCQCCKINAKALGGDKNSAGVLYFKLFENLVKVAEDKLTFNSLNLDRLEDHLRTVL